MSNPVSLSIGAVAKRAGCSVPTIRYYEDIGLMPAAARTGAGQRSYGEAAVQRLTFIRRCRDFGFSIEQVRQLAGLVDEPGRPCAEVRSIAAGHLVEVRRKLKELTALAASLQAFVRDCDAACADGTARDCTILDGLAEPATAPRCCG